MEEVDRLAIVRVKQQLGESFKPNLWIYWADLFVSSAVGWSAFVIALYADSLAVKVLSFIVCTCFSYRALAFTHELEHQPDGALPYLRPFWHLVSGMPYCLPHFLYRGVHRIHHSLRYYGTPDDPEYVAFVTHGSFREPILYLVMPFVFPVMVSVRYLVLSPLSLFVPPLRTWVVTKASAFVMKLDYARRVPTGREMTILRFEEFSTVLFLWSIVALVWYGQLPATVFLMWYLVFTSIMVLNGFRGLAATHRYASNGEVMSFEDHIYDSVNLQRVTLLNAIVAPLGLHYHATHHIFPTLPYYMLPRAHRLLMQASEGEGRPLGFYLTGQWSSLTSSIPKIVQLIREAKPQVSINRPESESKPTVAPVYPDF